MASIKPLISTLFVVLLTSVISMFAEQWIKPHILPKVISIDAYTSEWQPYPINGSPNPQNILKETNFSDHALEELSSSNLNNFTTFVVQNLGTKDIQGLTIELGSHFSGIWAPDAIILPPDKKADRIFIEDATDIKLPILPPGK